jgi:hypothetical protein
LRERTENTGKYRAKIRKSLKKVGYGATAHFECKALKEMGLRDFWWERTAGSCTDEIGDGRAGQARRMIAWHRKLI